jgi:hypothetical protein
VVSFGFLAGWIAQDLNPFIVVATGTPPAAMFFIFTNAAQLFGLCLMQVIWGRPLLSWPPRARSKKSERSDRVLIHLPSVGKQVVLKAVLKAGGDSLL